MAFGKGRRGYEALIDDSITDYKNMISIILSLLNEEKKKEEDKFDAMVEDISEGDIPVRLSLKIEHFVLPYDIFSTDLKKALILGAFGYFENTLKNLINSHIDPFSNKKKKYAKDYIYDDFREYVKINFKDHLEIHSLIKEITEKSEDVRNYYIHNSELKNETKQYLQEKFSAIISNNEIIELDYDRYINHFLDIVKEVLLFIERKLYEGTTIQNQPNKVN